MPQGKGTYGSQVGRPPKSNKVEMAHHISGIRKNKTGAKLEARRKGYLKSLDVKDQSPAKMVGYSPFRMKAADHGNSPMKKNFGEFGVGTPEAPKKVTAKSPNKFLGGLAGQGFFGKMVGMNPKLKALIEKRRAAKAQKQAAAAAPEEDATAETAAAEDAAAGAEAAETGAEEGGGVAPHGPEAHTGGAGPIGKGGGGLGGIMKNFFGKGRARPRRAGGGVGAMFSDVRLKEKIERAGVSPSGIPIYEFNYIGSNNRYSGAMAQDLLEINPSAVMMDSSGYYKVNYNDIDVDMHQVNN